MASRVTLNDIAAAANVSKATVSKALNDTGQLSARTRPAWCSQAAVGSGTSVPA